MPARLAARSIAVPTVVVATCSAAAQDMPGAKDFAGIERFAGSTIIGDDTKRSDAYTLQTGA